MKHQWNKRIILGFLITLSVLNQGCQDRIWDNPFDSECPKEIFTPSSFLVSLEGTSVKLSWKQENLHISGFEIFRSVEGGEKTSVATPGKTETSWIDDKTIPGKIHEYHIVALARANTSNEKSISVTVPAQPSIVFTEPLTKVYATSAIIGGKIISDGGGQIQAKGICWHTSANPTIVNSKTNEGSGTGAFVSTLTGLSPSTTYYARTYSTTSAGTSYGGEATFKTFYGEVTDIDGNIYPTTKIGDQVWMAENLKVTKYNDGAAIPNVTDGTSWSNLTEGAYCIYDNNPENKNIYGALYNWHAVNTGKLAPSGWHVATHSDWSKLLSFVGSQSPGLKLKSKDWPSSFGMVTNETAFGALPGGIRTKNFEAKGSEAYWWATNEFDQERGGTWWLLSRDNSLGSQSDPKYYGHSVRCLLGVLSKPEVVGNQPSNLTANSVQLSGQVTSDGNAPVTERGFVYGTSQNPTTANTRWVMGSGTGSFNATITGLSPNTTYYARAYAINSAGTAYGSQITFTTSAIGLPSVITSTAITVNSISAVLGGNVTSDGNATVTERGIVYSTTQNPTTANNKTAIGSGTGSFSTTIAGLTPNTTYYVRAYAINSQGTAYGDQELFSVYLTYDTYTDTRDGKSYKTIKIGDQVWMAENLAYLPSVSPSGSGSITSPYYYVYDYQGTNVAAAKLHINYKTYGVLYNWPAAMAGAASSSDNPSKVQGVCPSGWHLPSDAEWNQLEWYLIYNGYNYDGTTTENKFAKSMAATTNWNTDTRAGVIGNNLSLNNKSGFSALPGGLRWDKDRTFSSVGIAGNWLGSTENDSSNIWYRQLNNSSDARHRGSNTKANGYSVRCVRD